MSRVSFAFWLDVVLLAAVAVLQTPRSTGLPAHEWGAIVFAALIMLHLLVNWSWVAGVVRRVRAFRSWRDRVSLLLNAALLVVVVLSLFSGLMISEVLIPFIGLERSSLEIWTSLHRSFCTAALVVVGLHLALNWDWVVGATRTGQFLRRPAARGARVRLGRPRVTITDLARAGQRACVIACVAATVSVACYAIVRLSTSSERPAQVLAQPLGSSDGAHGWIAYNGFAVQATPILARREAETIFIREVATALLFLALATLAGRVVFRLRL